MILYQQTYLVSTAGELRNIGEKNVRMIHLLVQNPETLGVTIEY